MSTRAAPGAPPLTRGVPSPLRHLALWLAAGATVLSGAAAASAAGTPHATGWRVVQGPSEGTSAVGFSSVACAGATFCMAVGGAQGAMGSHPFTARWNGTAWTLLPAAPGEPALAYLDGVACVSPRWCMAVGQSRTTLAELWDGTAWSVVPTRSPRTGGSVLSGVACRSTRWCQAVGDSYNAGGQDRTLIEAWDGTQWSLAASPNKTTLSNWLDGVACTSHVFCEAVGYVAVNPRGGGASERDLAARFDGRHWTIVATPDRAGATNDLFGVACTSSAWCVAVGRAEVRRHKALTDHSELEVWDGRTWALVTTAATDSPIRRFASVTCRSRRSCTVVGTRTQRGIVHTSVLTWDGARWAVVPSPDARASREDALLSVSCPTPSRCEAVGYDRTGHVVGALTEQGP